jgi:hypothetical protein
MITTLEPIEKTGAGYCFETLALHAGGTNPDPVTGLERCSGRPLLISQAKCFQRRCVLASLSN